MTETELLTAMEHGFSYPRAIAEGMAGRIAHEMGYAPDSDVARAAQRAAREMYAAIIARTWSL